MQFAAECVTRTVLGVISFGVRVGGGADVLEIALRDGRFVSRKRASRSCCCLASAEENDSDEGRENGQGETAKFSVGQGRSPANLLTLIHTRARCFSTPKSARSHINRKTESLRESKTYQKRRMDRCDSAFGNGVVSPCRAHSQCGRFVAR